MNSLIEIFPKNYPSVYLNKIIEDTKLNSNDKLK